MKKLLLLLALATALPVMQTGCSTPANERVAAVTTLKAVGQTRDAAMKVAAQKWRDGEITDAKRDEIIAFHDNVFQKSYLLAVQAVQSNLTLAASEEILNLLTQLQTLIYSNK